MKQIFVFSLTILLVTGCRVSTYIPYAENQFGAQTTVVLDKANFRVVRDVEAIVVVDNQKASRIDITKSAYGQLLKKAQLTGSQVLINVVIEEIRTDSPTNRHGSIVGNGAKKRYQYIAARATIIEFLNEQGQPIQSVQNNSYSTTSLTKGKIEERLKHVSNHFTQKGWAKRPLYRTFQFLMQKTKDTNQQECLLTVMENVVTGDITISSIEQQLAKVEEEEKLNVFLNFCE